MSLDGLHGDRGRAESFRAVADDYDKYRPSYPEELIAHLVGLRPADVLDIGCGTGKAGLLLADRGLAVLGVEPDPRMAGAARRKGLPVEIARFEDWVDGGRRFDLIVCGQAWHWIDPARGVAAAARLLRPGGTIARFWNYHVLDQTLADALHEIYSRHAPTIHPPGRDPDGGKPDPDPFDGAEPFIATETTTYRWTCQMTADEWVGFLATFSDHQQLGPARLADLQREVLIAIRAHANDVRVSGGTYTRFARRA